MIDLELCTLKLNNFDCSYNRIIRLPLNLREMNSLIELNVDHNPLETPPAPVRYLFNNRKKQKELIIILFRFVHLVYFI
jgi:Leucine-rich repeat (LRR) protein